MASAWNIHIWGLMFLVLKRSTSMDTRRVLRDQNPVVIEAGLCVCPRNTTYFHTFSSVFFWKDLIPFRLTIWCPKSLESVETSQDKAHSLDGLGGLRGRHRRQLSGFLKDRSAASGMSDIQTCNRHPRYSLMLKTSDFKHTPWRSLKLLCIFSFVFLSLFFSPKRSVLSIDFLPATKRVGMLLGLHQCLWCFFVSSASSALSVLEFLWAWQVL